MEKRETTSTVGFNLLSHKKANIGASERRDRRGRRRRRRGEVGRERTTIIREDQREALQKNKRRGQPFLPGS